MANTKTDGRGQNTKNTEMVGNNGNDYGMMMATGVAMMGGIGVLAAGGLAAGGLGLLKKKHHQKAVHQPAVHPPPVYTPAVHPPPVHTPAVHHAPGCGKFSKKNCNFFLTLLIKKREV